MALREPVSHVKVGRQCRLVIPAELRRKLGITEGEALIAREEGGRLVLERPAAVLTRIRQRLRSVPDDVSLVEDLLAERRREAKRE